MKYTVSLSGDAEKDLDESFLWYEIQKINLGVDFANCIDEYFELIMKYPEAFPIVFKNIRRVTTKKFPYYIYYKINDSIYKIEIIAILHSSRSPDIIHARV